MSIPRQTSCTTAVLVAISSKPNESRARLELYSKCQNRAGAALRTRDRYHMASAFLNDHRETIVRGETGFGVEVFIIETIFQDVSIAREGSGIKPSTSMRKMQHHSTTTLRIF